MLVCLMEATSPVRTIYSQQIIKASRIHNTNDAGENTREALNLTRTAAFRFHRKW